MKHRETPLQRSRKFITTFERLKSFEVDSSRHGGVKSSQVESDVLKSTPSTWGHFSLKSGHVSVPQRLAGLRVSTLKLGRFGVSCVPL